MNQCGETCSTHGCHQGPGCAAHVYRANFDHLGQQIEQDPPWTLHELVLCALFVLVVAGLSTGFFN